MPSGKYISIDSSGDKIEEQGIQSSSGSADSDKLIRTTSGGTIDSTFLPGIESVTLTASEALDAGDLINVWDDAGTPSMRKADASGSKPAHGFVLESVSSASTGKAYGEGKVTGLSGLTPGSTYFLSSTTPGDVTDSVITDSGYILQKVGIATSATTLVFERGEAIQRA